jgi:hypothetical protein
VYFDKASVVGLHVATTVYCSGIWSSSPVEIAGVTFFQIEAEVVKNSACIQFIDGMFDQNEVLNLLTKIGGAGVGLHFPGCPTGMDLALKFASVNDEHEMFQVWGTTFSGRDLKTPLIKLVLDKSREAFFA